MTSVEEALSWSRVFAHQHPSQCAHHREDCSSYAELAMMYSALEAQLPTSVQAEAPLPNVVMTFQMRSFPR
jgi:hypothetical protein